MFCFCRHRQTYLVRDVISFYDRLWLMWWCLQRRVYINLTAWPVRNKSLQNIQNNNNHNRSVCPSIGRASIPGIVVAVRSILVRSRRLWQHCERDASVLCVPSRASLRAVRVMLLPGACVRVRAVCCGARPVWRHSRTLQTRSI